MPKFLIIKIRFKRMKNAIQFLLRRFGYEVYRTWEFSGELEYEPVRPLATYAPWNGDNIFQDIYGVIKKYTLVDKYRCYELWALIEQCSKMQGDFIEIGVWRGGTGALIAAGAKRMGSDKIVYLCDTFKGVVKAGRKDCYYKGDEHGDTSMRIVEKLVIDRLRLDNFKILKGIFPDETSHLVESSQFALCHIDVDVYQSAKDIVEWIWDKIVVGGIVVYDDYGFQTCRGITKYVEEQRPCNDRLVIHNLNGHALIVKIK